ncbi:hypothetical protein F5888DRAFT_1638040 [Russula emetica]|nr:hypothetical protein F5888DRAFT_1638040 [Russula emetica]
MVERLDIETDHMLSDVWDEEAVDSDSDSDSDSGAAQQWLELLAPFRRVRWLELIGTPVPSIASALEKSAAGKGCREVLPSLQSLHLRGPTMSPPIESFVAARQRSGHVVSVHFVGTALVQKMGEFMPSVNPQKGSQGHYCGFTNWMMFSNPIREAPS